LTAFMENDEVLVLALATPVAERLSGQKEIEQHTRAFAAIDGLLKLLTEPDTGLTPEAILDSALKHAQTMLGADAVGLYRGDPGQPGLTLRHALDVPAFFPARLAPHETSLLMSPLIWINGNSLEPPLQRGVRRAGWHYFNAHPVGEGDGALGALFAAYRPTNPPISLAPALLAIAARHFHHLVIHLTRTAHEISAHDRAVQLANRLAAINAEVAEGIVVIGQDGTLDEINTAAAQMLGYRSEDIVGLPHGDVLFFDDPLTEALRQGLNGAGLAAREGQLLRRSGEAFPVLARLRPLPDLGCVLTLRDLSSARATEIREEHLDHLAYVGETTQAFAHEVRAPLNNIALSAQYLKTRYPEDETTQQFLSQIEAECHRLNDMMKDMLAWAKPLDPQRVPFELGALLQRLVTRWNSKIKRQGVKLNVSIADDCPPVLADPKLIERVFVNLFENALYVMPAGGHLSIALRTIARGPYDTVVEAAVTDSGPGMPEDVRRRVFDPHFTTKPDGTGLGLAMCKRIITVHHGGISVESYPGTGTIFKITLPALDPTQSHTPTQLEL
jgi:two-component system nitrogen regulation sensor histidine kinase GlnL